VCWNAAVTLCHLTKRPPSVPLLTGHQRASAAAGDVAVVDAWYASLPGPMPAGRSASDNCAAPHRSGPAQMHCR